MHASEFAGAAPRAGSSAMRSGSSERTTVAVSSLSSILAIPSSPVLPLAEPRFTLTADGVTYAANRLVAADRSEDANGACRLAAFGRELATVAKSSQTKSLNCHVLRSTGHVNKTAAFVNRRSTPTAGSAAAPLPRTVKLRSAAILGQLAVWTKW